MLWFGVFFARFKNYRTNLNEAIILKKALVCKNYYMNLFLTRLNTTFMFPASVETGTTLRSSVCAVSIDSCTVHLECFEKF